MRDFSLWLEDAPERVKKPKGKHGKKKMPPENPGKELADKAIAGETFGDIPEILLQTLFMKTAVSVERGLIAKNLPPTGPVLRATQTALRLRPLRKRNPN